VEWLPDAAVVVGMFVLRLGVPLAITFAVAYFLRRLDARWQAEAWLEWEAGQPQGEVSAEAAQLQVGKQACWSIKGCDETARANCAAFQQPEMPCWLARRRAEGKLPAECYNCALFSLRQVA